MVGIGPFVVLSTVADIMQGPWFLYAWIAGALLSFVDATIWLGIFFSTGQQMIFTGLAVIAAGIVAFCIKAKYNKEWPF